MHLTRHCGSSILARALKCWVQFCYEEGLRLGLRCVVFVVHALRVICFPQAHRPRGEGASGFFASVQYKLAVPHFRDFIVEDKGKALNTFAMKEKQQGGTAKAATGAATPPADPTPRLHPLKGQI